jgi:hypothetical protein
LEFIRKNSIVGLVDKGLCFLKFALILLFKSCNVLIAIVMTFHMSAIFARVVNKSIVKSVVKKSVYSDRLIAVKLKAEALSILIVQMYIPTSDYEDDEVKYDYNGRLEQCGWR